jgi:hypothetical protein
LPQRRSPSTAGRGFDASDDHPPGAACHEGRHPWKPPHRLGHGNLRSEAGQGRTEGVMGTAAEGRVFRWPGPHQVQLVGIRLPPFRVSVDRPPGNASPIQAVWKYRPTRMVRGRPGVPHRGVEADQLLDGVRFDAAVRRKPSSVEGARRIPSREQGSVVDWPRDLR